MSIDPHRVLKHWLLFNRLHYITFQAPLIRLKWPVVNQHVKQNTARRPSMQVNYINAGSGIRLKRKISRGGANSKNTHNIISLMVPHDFNVFTLDN